MKDKDDNIWADYTEEYMRDIILTYRDGNNSFFIEEGFDRLHPNFKAIYRTAQKINPKSILECGCGGCYHLKNLSWLLPDCDIHGFDITQKQISFGMWFSQLPPKVEKNLFVMDLAGTVIGKQFEFVFTQAVIMHMSTERAMKALSNMKKLSSKYVFMVENPTHHGSEENWANMVNEVFGDWEITHPFEHILITKP